MSVELKVYLTEEQTDENLCFHSVINSRDDYDLFVDLNETYEEIMLEFLDGTFELDYLDTETFEKNTYTTPNVDIEESINNFVSFLNEFYGLTAVSNTFNLYAHFGVRLVGAGFRGNANSPMLEHSQFNAFNSIHSIKNSLFVSANNVDYVNEDIYIKKAHGSLKLTLEATTRYSEPIDFITEVYNDIQNETVDPFRYENEEKRIRYQNIIKHLNDLNAQRRLKEFYIIIDGQEYQITKRDYLKVKSKAIYNEDIEILGIYEGYKKGSNSFELTVDNHGKYFCHLNNLKRNNEEQFDSLYQRLREINIFDNSVLIKVIGERIKPKTINVTNIEIL